ncbi:MAG: glycosyltransferase [Microthrixaceae bacterium]
MDVLLVDTLSVPGGAERSLAHLAGALPGSGVRPRALVGEPGPLVDWFRQVGCPVGVADDLPGAIARSLRDHPTEAVLSVGARGHRATADAAAGAGVPAAWWMELMPNGRPAEVEALDLPTAAILAPSPAVAAAQRTLLAGTPADCPVHLVPPGIPTTPLAARISERAAVRAALGWDDRIVVGLVARIDRNKGQTAFIDAASRLSEHDDRLRFLVVGGAVLGREGRLAEHLTNLVERRDLGDRLRLVGHTADPVPLQVALDVAVSASAHESFGLSVLESMTLGTPVVATRTAGSVFLLDDGAAGWLCEPLDTDALVSTISQVVTALDGVGEPDELDRVRAARLRAASFDATRTAELAAGVLRGLGATP